MKSGQIIDLFRLRADDLAPPYLWERDEVFDYLNEAQEEAARRARLLIDSSTTEVCQIAVTVAAGARYALDERVIFVRNALFVDANGVQRRLKHLSHVDLDMNRRTRWQDDEGTIEAFIQDLDTGYLQLYRKPTVAGTLYLTVVRLPLLELNDEEETPEINRRYHRALVDWMLYRAYLKDDDDTKDLGKAAAAEARFIAEFGDKSAAIDEEWRARTHFDDLDGDR